MYPPNYLVDYLWYCVHTLRSIPLLKALALLPVVSADAWDFYIIGQYSMTIGLCIFQAVLNREFLFSCLTREM